MADLELVSCVPCQSTGESLPAVKYCINCSDPLCKTCVEFHMKFRATKAHKLVDCSTRDTRHFKGAKQLSIYMTCPDHDDSTVKLLCEEHGALCCLTCATTTHRNCRHVSEINKLAAGCKTSGQIDKIRTRLEETGTCMQEIIDVNDACRIDFENSKDEIPRRLEEIKRKILKLFERMESAVLETVKNLHTDEDIAMGDREENWKLKLNANVELLEMLDAISEIGTESQLFVALQKMKSALLESENALLDQGSHIIGQSLKLQLKDKLENFMQTDVIDNLVAVESIQNQYQLPKTVAYSKPGCDIDVASASDSIQDIRNEEKTTEPSDKRTLDRFPGSDRMKALHFLGIFMSALRWHQAESVVRFVAAELFFKSAPQLLRSKGGFTTTEGIKVYVYKHDILKLDVDCIVNAANKEMRHGGGVAKVIARAAGYELERDSRSYVNAFGDLRVGSCCSTSAGNLKYKCVIHTVGPDINDYMRHEYPQMRQELRQAVRVCFEEAERQYCSSIGMTSISSGVYGVPKPWCAEEYARAVYDYSSNPNRLTVLKEIHFVDISEEMLNETKKAFQTVLYGTDTRESKDNRDGHAKYDSTNYRKVEDQRPKHQYPKWYKRYDKWVFELKQDFRVVIYTDNITQFNTGAIACSQDANLRCTGGIAKALSKMAGSSFQENLKRIQRKGMKLKTGDVVITEPGNLNCVAIYHIVSPDFTTQIGQKACDGFLKDFHTGYVNCLHEVRKRGVSKIAIPLFGCGILKEKVGILVETFLNAVVSFISDPKVTNSQLSEVHVINDRDGITQNIKTVFLNYVEATTERLDPDSLDAKSDDHRSREPVYKDRDTGHGPGDKDDVKEDEKVKGPETDLSTEKCPICMNTFDNPKQLSNCGHVFCTDCIEAQFKVTSKCPNCFMVYGVIMGDQPEGEMNSYSDYRTRLPGYENCSTIVITYDFPDGVQGPDHPQPGTRYRGIRRNGYLPDNKAGRQILKMLEIAFKRKLVFTIGSSRTTGKEGVITWNDIHHKTDPRPHSTFGYPDPSYLERVKDELAAKGVTPDDIK